MSPSARLENMEMLRQLPRIPAKEYENSRAKASKGPPFRNGKINTIGLRFLQESLGLLPDAENPSALDVIFIAIDFEHSHLSVKKNSIQIREMGISLLDTRKIGCENPISSQHYRTVTNTKRRFLFGTSIDKEQDELVIILKELLLLESRGRKFEPRKLILVGHGFSFEMKALKTLGIDVTLAPTIENIFDTYYLALEVFRQDLRLSRLTRQLGIEASHFHNAGNDANFTLRAMLLLAINGMDFSENNINNNPQLSKLIGIYNEIARSMAQIPPPPRCRWQITPKPSKFGASYPENRSDVMANTSPSTSTAVKLTSSTPAKSDLNTTKYEQKSTLIKNLDTMASYLNPIIIAFLVLRFLNVFLNTDAF